MLRSAPPSRRLAPLAVLACTAVAALSLLGIAPAGAAPAAPGTAVVTASDVDPAPDAPIMPTFSLDSYAAEADELPAGLREAISADLGRTAEEYLAGADAAAAAVEVVEGLKAEGVSIASFRLDGTALTVTVSDEADVEAVEAVDAVAEVGPARTDARTAATDDGAVGVLEPLASDFIAGGQGYLFGNETDAFACSVAFNGVDAQYGFDAFLTAGHCQADRDSGFTYELNQNKPGDPGTLGQYLGDRVGGTFAFGNELDSGVVRLQTNKQVLPRVGTWNSGKNNGPVTAGDSLLVRDYGDAVVGQSLCKSGSTSGWTCGTVTYVDQLLEIGEGGPQVNLDIVKGMCSKPGDSGGSVVAGPYAMGVLSAGSVEGNCTSSGSTAVFPMVAPKVDGEQYGSVRSSQKNWELGVLVPGAVVSNPEFMGELPWGQSISGVVEDATTNYSVTVVIDRDSAKKTYTSRVAAGGSWSVLPTDIPDGSHTCVAYVTFGTQRGSGTDCGFTSVGAPEVERIAGPDRYAGAVAIAQASYPGTAPVVYVATGQNYPDALSAAPAAVVEGGPLLLVNQNAVPAVVADEIRALAPQRIVVVGGPNAVSAGVVKTLGTLVKGVDVKRLAGADRYAASRAVVSAVFDEVAHAYVATGANFPDALSAGGAAGSAGEPVVLVDGGAATAGTPTLDLFRTLKTSGITVVGGPNSVSPGVASSLAAVPAAVDRVSSSDRYQTSIALNRSAFTASDTVYLATGQNFPDALAGAVLAGASDAPLYVVPGDCVPRGVLTDIGTLGATKVVLFGGPAALQPSVAALTPCSF